MSANSGGIAQCQDWSALDSALTNSSDMSADPVSTRHRGSPLTRRSRDVPPPANNCLEVQWRFLQHKNPQPPQFGSPSRKPLLVDPMTPQALRPGAPEPSEGTHQAPRGSPSRLFHLFETQGVETEETNPVSVSPSTTQESNLPESPRASRTLNDLMGETQRQAMLDRILADMEYLVVEPTYARLGQAGSDSSGKANSPRKTQRARSHKPSILQTALQNEPKGRLQPKQRRFTALWTISSQGGYLDAMDDVDDDDDDDSADGSDAGRGGHEADRKRRQRRKLQQLHPGDEGPRIFWQQTTGARSAADVPDRLLTLSPSPPRRLRSSHNIVLGRRSYTSRQLLSPSTLNQGPQRSQGDASAQRSPQAGSTAARRHRRRLPAAPASPGRSIEAPASPSKAHYGAWYVPQSEWWTLRQLEQQSIADKLPAPSAACSDADEPHCHGSSSSPTQRQHKPPLPPAALSPRAQESIPAKAASSGGGSRMPSASCRTAPPSAPGPLELHVAGIPQSYIGREYRAYIVSTGSAMPQYLQ
jgi:hypothetical protein